MEYVYYILIFTHSIKPFRQFNYVTPYLFFKAYLSLQIIYSSLFYLYLFLFLRYSSHSLAIPLYNPS